MKTHIQRLTFFLMATMLFQQCVSPDKPLEDQKELKPTPLFNQLSSEKTGIVFNNTIDERYEIMFDPFAHVYNGGGVATTDINNDGLIDIYFTGNEVPNKLYLNKGNMQFEDITSSAGIEGSAEWTNGVSVVDINGDGWQDIYICMGGWKDTPQDRKNLLFINNGNLTFSEKAADYGLADTGYSVQASFFDLDNDNDLDMYLINRPDVFNIPVSEFTQKRLHPPNDSRDKLYVNINGTFVEQGKKRGLGQNYAHGLNVVTADLNQDGYQDIYVSNDFQVDDYLYINQKDGTFKESIKKFTNHISYSSMGSDIADINNDGLEDIVIMEMRSSDYKRSKVSMAPMSTELFNQILEGGMQKQYMHNMLLLNTGNSFFSEISQYSGISKTDWSWATLCVDLDNDGLRDLFVTNGMRRDISDNDIGIRLVDFVRKNKHKYASAQEMYMKASKEIINLYGTIKEKNQLFRNEGSAKYEEVTDEWGISTESFSNGAAVADLDNDGDLDMVVNNIEEKAFVYENTASDKSNYIKINLEGPDLNRNGLGAKIWVFTNGKMQYFQNKTVRGYLSTSEPIVHFGMGEQTQIDSIKVVWNNESISLVSDIETNQTLNIKYANANATKNTSPPHSPIFVENTHEKFVSPFKHQENVYNEYEEQILLPHSFSRNGPYMAVGDINGDKKEDIFVGGATGQPAQLYVQYNGAMKSVHTPLLKQDSGFEDMGAEFVDIDGDGDTDLLVSSGGSQYEEGSQWYRSRIYYNDGSGNFHNRVFLPTISSSSCISSNDIDADGDLDILVTGHVVADKYLEAPRSHIFINNQGVFKDKTHQIAPQLAHIGMITSSIWADINGDKQNELVLVGEWMPLTIFEYKSGQLMNVTSSYLGTENTTGWWNKVSAADLDKDGDLDLVAGNLGENYKFKASKAKPFEVYAGDFDNNGTHDIFLAKKYYNRLVPIRGKECTSQQMPGIAQKFTSYNAFANADLPDIIGANIKNALHGEAYMFSSVILENKNGKFEIKKMPMETQLSTLMGITIEDFDADGHLDILVAGNRFDVEIETTASDASTGYLLKGDGDLNYKTLTARESGFFEPFNVKDLKMITIDKKQYVLVAINDGHLKVYEKQ